MKRDWPIKSLGDVCRLISGQHIDAKDYSLQMKGIGYLTGPSDFGALHPVVSKWTEHPKITAERGDILLTVKGSGVGKVNVLSDDRVAISRQLMSVRVTGADPGFVYRFLSFAGEHLQSLSTGAAIPGISREQVLGLAIPLPPLPEQQRIVALLDEALAGLATAKANAERNLHNAREAFESHLRSVFANQWQTCELVRLAELATDITDGDHQPPPKSPIGVPFITIRNIMKGSREIDFSDTFTVPRDYFDALKAHKKPRQGDVLYTVTGSFGIPVIVRGDAEFCFQRHIALVRPRPEINSSWLYYLLMSPQVFRKASDGATGTAQKTVSLTLLRSLAVPKVPPQQQRQSVEKLDALVAETQHLTHIYERKLAALEELKKSLLQQAFNGEL